ncbi:GPI transamidase component PIG-S [Cynara cardunculus var. scolymus]|uniref:GPI transamidase component PIG-S n=1 Tax=Cynara cardunculus var. scolymus TaxID=59895 RepID=UPI000D6278AB|nr:GPI transamidase component PIG-S [Cynara cardunculus var. scolymus]
MAEITETMGNESSPSEENRNENSERSNFDNKTMRKSKPGLKRLALTLTVFFSFLLGLPWLLKSIEIYRSPLPFRDIDSLSNAIDSNPFLFPCKFHAVFVNFEHSTPIKQNAEQLGFLVSSHMLQLADGNSFCGTCESKYTVSVSLDSGNGCVEYEDADRGRAWRCGALSEFKFDETVKNDEVLDEYLESVVGRRGRVYTVVVVNAGEGYRVRAVVGKHRHAWIVGRFSEVDMLAEKVAEMFVKIFVGGAKEEGAMQGEFMPVGADGKIVLSFNLLNADPRDWIYDWDFKEVDEKVLSPTLEALGPIANISVESQVLYHTPKSSYSYWDVEVESHIFSTKDLPFFVNSNEWHLDTSIAAGGRSKILQFVVYIPSANECPLRLQLPNGEISMTNAFISPTWGGVVVLNPPNCLGNANSMHPLRRKVSPQELNQIFEVFMGQLRQLFGLKSTGFYKGASGSSILLASERGFTEWELDVLARQHACFNLRQCGTTLGSLSRLVQSLPRMIIKDEIGKQVKLSLEAAKLAQNNASQGIFDASVVSSRHARSLAEDAFFHPSVMSVSYYSFEHCFAVYSPFFLPLSLHVILAVVREIKRYKQESRKYAAWKAVGKQHAGPTSD